MKKCCAKVKPNSVVGGIAEETARVDQILKSGVGEETEEEWKDDVFLITGRYRRRSWPTEDGHSYRRSKVAPTRPRWDDGERDQVADSKPGWSCDYWNTWRIVDENMRGWKRL